MTGDTTHPPRTTYHHGDLRRALLVAAEAELIERGIEGFTLRGVARRAGVSHAAPAHHFKDTAAMLTALAATAAQRLKAAMSRRREAAPDDPRSRFVASGTGYIDFALENPALFTLLFGSGRPDSDDPDLVRHAGAAFADLVEAIAAISGKDPLADAEGRLDVAAAWSLVHGAASLLVAGRMKPLRPAADADREAWLQRLVGRIVPG
ncbi:MAG TPA: TetR/AcrR family transcriptional regulator [Rhizobiales bacterium]|nr:TetR/AcrR family transcriptional regulator [Hyphomicrobiales bacterium]